MKRHNFKKKFGQNFLRNKKFVHTLLEPLDINPNDNVIEIGPGDGMISEEILQRGANLLCIEIDTELINTLKKKYNDYSNFKIINEDILSVNIEEVVEKYLSSGSLKVTGSLPFNISKDIITNLLKFNTQASQGVSIDKMCFIVQEEVAKSYASKPPKATLLSVRALIYSQIKKFESIPRGQFEPKPNVDGGIIYFELNKEKKSNLKELETLVKIGFSSPRKTLINNIKNSKKYINDNLREIFDRSNLSYTVRPSELELTDWVRISNFLTLSSSPQT